MAEVAVGQTWRAPELGWLLTVDRIARGVFTAQVFYRVTDPERFPGKSFRGETDADVFTRQFELVEVSGG